MWSRLSILFGFVAGVAACQNTVDFGSTQDPTESFQFTGFMCDPSQAPGGTELIRLSSTELKNHLEDSLRDLVPGNASDIIESLKGLYSIHPNDLSGHDRPITPAVVSAHFTLADAVAAQLVASDAILSELGGACLLSNPDANCLQSLVSKVGLRLFGRPLSNEEVTEYHSTYTNASEYPLRAMLSALILSPNSLFILENQGNIVAPGTYALTSYEYAKRLSLIAWKSSPDTELLNLLESQPLQSQPTDLIVNHLLASKKAERGVSETFTEIYQIGNKAELSIPTNEQSLAALDGLDFNKLESLGTDSIEEVRRLVAKLYSEGRSLNDLLYHAKDFVGPENLRQIYEISASATTIPEHRHGIFSRAFFPFASSIITRGVNLRMEWLCDEVGDAVENDVDEADLVLPESTSFLSSRETTEKLTAPAACASCHSYIDDLAFPLEHFDNVGRFRKFETVFDIDGTPMATHPINAVAVPQVMSGDTRPVSTPKELVDRLAESRKLEACFVRRVYELATKKVFNELKDGCAAQDVFEAAVNPNQPLKETFSVLLRSEELKYKREK